MSAYYNDVDPYCAQWLRNLIAQNLIAPGDVDERSIKQVQADDLRGYRQCHFFAGIGGWSLALRLAGWPDDRAAWTASCPCQPFSVAGKRRGENDERHLWPDMLRIIRDAIAGGFGPRAIFGEQVASKDGRVWLAGIRTDLEALAYDVWAADICAAGVGAPHIRQRLWWVADADNERRDGIDSRVRREEAGRSESDLSQAPRSGAARGLALAGCEPAGRGLCRSCEGACSPRGGASNEPCGSSGVGGLEHAARDGREQRRPEPIGRGSLGRCGARGMADAEAPECECERAVEGGVPHRLADGGAWGDFDLIPCLDGKARRIEPGSFPLAHGVSNRVGKLRAYGNAIVPQVAAEVVAAFMEARP